MFLSARDRHVSATSYPSAKGDMDLNLIEIVKNQLANLSIVENVPTPALASQENSVESPKQYVAVSISSEVVSPKSPDSNLVLSQQVTDDANDDIVVEEEELEEEETGDEVD